MYISEKRDMINWGKQDLNEMLDAELECPLIE